MTTFTNWTFSVAGNIGPTGATGPAGTNGATGATGAEGSRNVLINGAFDIWQRGTSFSGTAGTRTFTADRWYIFPSGGNLASVVRTTGVHSGFGTYSAYSLFLVGNTNVTTCLVGQRIEAANMPSLRRTVTFSARIYNITGANFIPNLILSTPNAENDFSSVTQQSTNALGTAASNTWTTVTWTGDISGYTNISYGLQVEIQIPSGSLNTTSKFVGITEVQLEKGSVATPFARRSVGEELALCQRYFHVIPAGNIKAVNQYATVGLSGGNLLVSHTFPVTMRTEPTVYTSGGSGSHSFDFYQSSAGAGIARVLVYQSGQSTTTIGFKTLAYSSDNNGGNVLPSNGHLIGILNTAVWVSAEL